jgi:tryptophan-rich sensory protein
MTYFLMYLVYSIAGFLFLRDYSKKCIAVNIVPFNGSILKFIIMSFICGGITSILLVVSLIWSIFETFKEKR